MDSELLHIQVGTRVAVKLIINLSPALEGLCDWQSSAEASRSEAGESQNQQNRSVCQGAAAVPDGVWSRNQDLVRHSLPPPLVWSYGAALRGAVPPSTYIIKRQDWP